MFLSYNFTDCSVNEWNEFRDSDNCQSRYLQGQCASNNTDMLMNCTKSCFECDDDNNEIRYVSRCMLYETMIMRIHIIVVLFFTTTSIFSSALSLLGVLL